MLRLILLLVLLVPASASAEPRLLIHEGEPVPKCPAGYSSGVTHRDLDGRLVSRCHSAGKAETVIMAGPKELGSWYVMRVSGDAVIALANCR